MELLCYFGPVQGNEWRAAADLKASPCIHQFILFDKFSCLALNIAAMAEQGHPTFSNAEKQREAFSIAVSSEEEPNNPSAKKVWYLNRHLGVYNEGRYSHVVGECARFLQTETATPQDWFKDNFRGKLGVLKCIYKCRGKLSDLMSAWYPI